MGLAQISDSELAAEKANQYCEDIARRSEGVLSPVQRFLLQNAFRTGYLEAIADCVKGALSEHAK